MKLISPAAAFLVLALLGPRAYGQG